MRLARAVSIVAMMTVFCSTWVRAESAARVKVAVVPIGAAHGFVPTVQVASALVAKLNSQAEAYAKLAFVGADQLDEESPALKKAETLRGQAYRALAELELSQARDVGTKALSIYRDAMKSGASQDGYVKTLHVIAAAALFDGDEAAAKEAFNDAIALSQHPPDPTHFNPTVQKAFSDALQQQVRSGALAVDASSKVAVWVDGALVGTTPQELTLRPGVHLVRLAAPGFESVYKWVRVASDKRTTVSQSMSATETTEDVSAKLTDLRTALLTARANDDVTQQIAADTPADDVWLVHHKPDCNPTRCTIVLYEKKNHQWVVRQSAAWDPNEPDGVAGMLLAPVASADVVRDQSQDISPADCRVTNTCPANSGARPIYKRWWFWTAVGAVAVGTAVAIAIPLASQGSKVVIELK